MLAHLSPGIINPVPDGNFNELFWITVLDGVTSITLLHLITLDRVGGLSAMGEAKLRWKKDQTQYKQAKQQERYMWCGVMLCDLRDVT